MNWILRTSSGWLVAALILVAAVGCSDSDKDDDSNATPDEWVFDGASDALDGRFVGSLTTETQSLGLVLQVDQNRNLVYGPIQIGRQAGTFRGRFSGNDISFQAEVATEDGLGTDTYQFTGRIESINRFSGTFTSIVNGNAESGTWMARR